MLGLFIENVVGFLESLSNNFDAKASFRENYKLLLDREKYKLLLDIESPVEVHRDWMKHLED